MTAEWDHAGVMETHLAAAGQQETRPPLVSLSGGRGAPNASVYATWYSH